MIELLCDACNYPLGVTKIVTKGTYAEVRVVPCENCLGQAQRLLKHAKKFVEHTESLAQEPPDSPDV